MAGIILGVFSLGMFVPWSNSTVSITLLRFTFIFLIACIVDYKGSRIWSHYVFRNYDVAGNKHTNCQN